MLCLCGFELYSRWVPLIMLLIVPLGGVSKSITPLRLPGALPLFQYWFISLKRIISYKSSLTDALICLPWLNLEDSTVLYFSK